METVMDEMAVEEEKLGDDNYFITDNGEPTTDTFLVYLFALLLT